MTLAERLGRVSELLIALAGSPIPTHVFQTLADQAETVIAFDYLAVCLREAEGETYLVHPLAGDSAEAHAERPFAPGEGLPARAMATGRVVLIDDLAAEPDPAPDLEGRWTALGLRSALIAPVRRGPEVLGALVFAARAGSAYGPDDVQVASLVAAGLGAGFETSRVYQSLSDERSTLAAVLGSTQDAVVMVNPDGIVLLANPAVRPMLGLEPEALGGAPLPALLAEGPLRPLLEAGEPATVEIRLPDGRTALASVVPVRTAYGEAVGVAAILRDITLLKELEGMKNTFVNTVSHDLKNPLGAIVLTAEMMLRAGPARCPLRGAVREHTPGGPVHEHPHHRPPRSRQDRIRARGSPRGGGPRPARARSGHRAAGAGRGQEHRARGGDAGARPGPGHAGTPHPGADESRGQCREVHAGRRARPAGGGGGAEGRAGGRRRPSRHRVA